MTKNKTLLLVGGAAVALYLYSKSNAQAGTSGQGALPGGYYSNQGGQYTAGGYSGSNALGATRPRFRR